MLHTTEFLSIDEVCKIWGIAISVKNTERSILENEISAQMNDFDVEKQSYNMQSEFVDMAARR